MQSQNVATKNGLNIFEHFYASNIYYTYLLYHEGSNVYDTSKILGAITIFEVVVLDILSLYNTITYLRFLFSIVIRNTHSNISHIPLHICIQQIILFGGIILSVGVSD